MKRKIWTALLVAGLTVGMPAAALADTFSGDEGWRVVFTAEEEMDSNFKTSDIDDQVRNMQPGDSVEIAISLENAHSTTTNWYMTNEVLQSLEDSSYNSQTGGGAYTYRLTYTDKDGNETVLFDSDTVGGEDISAAGEGLNEATSALEDYFFLDTLAKGESGDISLTVALDGETQGNDYQDTLADLQMNFAVELAEGETTETPAPTETPTATATPTVTARATTTPAPANERATVVRTSDDTNIIPYLVVMAVCGLVILFVARRNWKKMRSKGEGGSER